MSQHSFGPRHPFRALPALDFGLRVRVEPHRLQRTLFSGAEKLSLQDLTSELAEMISSLRVRSYSVRGHLEQLTQALQVNVECGFWSLACRAALDLAAELALSRKRRLTDPELSSRGANAALRIAELCSREVR